MFYTGNFKERHRPFFQLIIKGNNVFDQQNLQTKFNHF